MQKGFATFEIILVVMIIAVLMTVTIPNVYRLADKVSLDYETKRLYSELRFLQAMNRSGTFSQVGTGLDEGRIPQMYIKFTSEPSSYQVVRGLGQSAPIIREPHYLSYSVKLSLTSGKNLYEISSSDLNKWDIGSTSLALTSRLNKKRYIIFDSVGRVRASFRSY